MGYSQLVRKQQEFVRSGKTKKLSFRVEQLKKLRSVIVKFESEIFQAINKDLGKHATESYVAEVKFVLNEIDHSIKELPGWMEKSWQSTPLVLLPAKSEVHYEPFGSSLIIAPWNYPFQLLISPLVASMTAGNASVVKASEFAPSTQAIIAKMINENFDEQYIKAVSGDVEESQALLKENFDFIFFTGSTRIGKVIMKAAAENLTPVCLELGGKSPCIVDQKTNLEVSARRITWGKFYNTGQTCVAPDYVYVHKKVAKEFKKLVTKNIESFFGQDPSQSEDYGRIINRSHFDRLVGLIDQEKVISGGKFNPEKFYIEPTVLENVTWQDPVMQEEIFGPIMPILEFDDLDELIETVNAKPKPLALYVFSKDQKFSKKVTGSISFGGGCVNDVLVHLANPDLPFGGVGDSGMGSYHGHFGFELFSHKKAVLKKSFLFDLELRYPPYTEFKERLFRKLL